MMLEIVRRLNQITRDTALAAILPDDGIEPVRLLELADRSA